MSNLRAEREALRELLNAARFLWSTLDGGFVRCERCGDQETTSDMDGVQDFGRALKAYDSAPPPATSAGARETAEGVVREWHRELWGGLEFAPAYYAPILDAISAALAAEQQQRKALEQDKRDLCPICHGLGWYSVADRNTGDEVQEQCDCEGAISAELARIRASRTAASAPAEEK